MKVVVTVVTATGGPTIEERSAELELVEFSAPNLRLIGVPRQPPSEQGALASSLVRASGNASIRQGRRKVVRRKRTWALKNMMRNET